MMSLLTAELFAIHSDLAALHNIAFVSDSQSEKQTRTFINVGEYALALDGIAYAYLDSDRTMPPDMFKTFEKLAIMMDLAEDAEFEGSQDCGRVPPSRLADCTNQTVRKR